MKIKILKGIVYLTNIIIFVKFVPLNAILIALVINVICLCLANINLKECKDNEKEN